MQSIRRTALIAIIFAFSVLIATYTLLQAKPNTGYPTGVIWSVEEVPLEDSEPYFHSSNSSKAYDSAGMLHVARWTYSHDDSLSELEYVYWDGTTMTTNLIFQSTSERVKHASIRLDQNEAPSIGFATHHIDASDALYVVDVNETPPMPDLVTRADSFQKWQFEVVPDLGPVFLYLQFPEWSFAKREGTEWMTEQFSSNCSDSRFQKAKSGLDTQNRFNVILGCSGEFGMTHRLYDNGLWQSEAIQGLPAELYGISNLHFATDGMLTIVYLTAGLWDEQIPTVIQKQASDVTFHQAQLPVVGWETTIEDIRLFVEGFERYHLMVVRGEFGGAHAGGYATTSLYYYAQFEELPYTEHIVSAQVINLASELILGENGMPIQEFSRSGSSTSWRFSADTVSFVELTTKYYLPLVE